MIANWFKTGLLFSGIVAIFGTIGGMFFGAQGMIIGLLFAGASVFYMYWNSDKMVLKMYRAREVDGSSAPQLYNMVAELAQRAELPMPRVYIVEENQPNAFATGRNPEHAAVAVTTGILSLLSARELRGVMAHELAHVRNRDMLISTVSATIAGAISAVANFGMFFGGRSNEDGESPNPLLGMLVLIIAPFAAMLIQFAISRTREFGADSGGADISGDPNALADALEKMEHYARRTPMHTAERHPETAQMMIVNPLSGGSLRGLFATHPDTQERIMRLRAMSA